MPKEAELRAGEPVLGSFLSIFRDRRVIAVGRIAYNRLRMLGIDCQPVRHPACGGAGKFREEMAKIVEGQRGRCL